MRPVPRFHAWAQRDMARNGIHKWNGAAFTVGFFWRPILEGHRPGDRIRAKLGFELLIRLPLVQWWEQPQRYAGYYGSYASMRWTGRRARVWRFTPPHIDLWSFRP